MKIIISMFQIIGFAITNPRIFINLLKIRRRHLTYLNIPALVDLVKAAQELERKRIPGNLIEAGCALGGSALAITVTKNAQRRFDIYDTFEMIPPPTENDGEDAHKRYEEIASGQSKGLGNDVYYGYLGDLRNRITTTFVEFGHPIDQYNVHLNKGYFQDTLIVQDAVALAHIDCDWYDSVMVCLERITPQLSIGGFLVIDDYQHWSSARQAVDDYFSTRKASFKFHFKSRLYIQKISPSQ